MANKSISMIHVRRIIQLKADGFSKLKISETLHIHRATLENYLSKLETTGQTYPQLLLLTDEVLSGMVYIKPPAIAPDARRDTLDTLQDYFNKELARPGVTRKILWEEYRRSYDSTYGYTQFCEHFKRFTRLSKLTMHLSHRPGEYLQIDFAGKILHYIDVKTGELIKCPVLVCTLPYSGYTYVEALPSGAQEYMFSALNRCLEYLGGVPRNVLSDNMKQFVLKNQRYEYTFPELANQWAVHYNTNLDACRPRKPKDKPTVENTVYLSYLRIYAKLRNQEFYSIAELNQRMRELLEGHNQAMFQKLPGNRQERFLQDEKALLKPLPQESFTIKHTTTGMVQMNYHVVLGADNHQYSAPYQYVGQKTKVIYDEKTVEIFIGFQRIAIHPRDHRRNGYSTLPEHVPEKHKKYAETLGWDADYFLSLAQKIGLNSVDVFTRVLAAKEFVEQTYKGCMGLKKLSEQYGTIRFEAACHRAQNASRVNYGMIRNILEKNLDKQVEPELRIYDLPDHDNIRGPESYN